MTPSPRNLDPNFTEVRPEDVPNTDLTPETVPDDKTADYESETHIVFRDARTGQEHGPMPRSEWADYERENNL